MNFSKMNLQDLWDYIGDLNTEASLLNVSATNLLEKYKISQKMPKDIFTIINNTLQAMSKGDIICNDMEIKPYEATEEMSKGVDFAIPLEDAIKVSNFKDVGTQLNNYVDWEVTRVNDNGVYLEPLDSKGDIIVCDKKNKALSLSEDNQILMTYKIGKDFTHMLHIEQEGIYLLKEICGKLEGVIKFRWSK